MTTLAIGDLALDAGEGTQLRRAPFLRGPVPWPWLARCGRLPGRAVHVGLALWFEAGMRKATTVVLRPKHLTALGVDRHAARRSLAAMERAGLVLVTRAPGRAHVVAIVTETSEAVP